MLRSSMATYESNPASSICWFHLAIEATAFNPQESASELDKGFLAAFAKIKQRDASIYDPNQRLFDEGCMSEGASEEDDGGSSKAARTSREKQDPKFLRQVLAEQVCCIYGPADTARNVVLKAAAALPFI